MHTELKTTNELSPQMLQHLEHLEFESPTQYRLWCHRNGLATGLEKDEDERARERDLVSSKALVEDVVRTHTERRAELITLLHQGEHRDTILTSTMSRLRNLFIMLENDVEDSDAFHRLMLHVEKYSKLFSEKHGFTWLGEVDTNLLMYGLSQLARNHRYWLRPIEEWRPKSLNERTQFSEISRYLLANYHVPQCFESPYFEEESDESRRQQKWFVHVGIGKNIRTADVPCRISKRMAHILLQETHRRPVLFCMRRAQVSAFTDDWRLAWSVAHHLDHFNDEAFWVTVVHFFLNNPFIERSYVGPVVDYFQAMKYTPTRIPHPDGSFVEGPPAHPNFSMKGRSATKLLALIDDWHEDLSAGEGVQGESWEKSGFREIEHQEVDPKTDQSLAWSVHELDSTRLLQHEGKVMHHCVGSYAKRCVTGERSVWSLRVLVDDDEKQKHILTIAQNNKNRTVTQARGKYNLQPHDRAKNTKQQNEGRPYLHLLRESARILKMWMDREGLRHGK